MKLFACALGALTALVSWVLLVPWDLSEVDESGQVLPAGGDANATAIVLVVGVVTVIGVALVLVDRHRAFATAFTAAGSITWAMLFAWRAAVSPTSGANMFVVPLVALVGPTALALPLLVRGLAARWGPSGRVRHDDGHP